MTIFDIALNEMNIVIFRVKCGSKYRYFTTLNYRLNMRSN